MIPFVIVLVLLLVLDPFLITGHEGDFNLNAFARGGIQA